MENGQVWEQFDNATPVLFDNNATSYIDALNRLAQGLPADQKGVAYKQTHTLLLNAVDVLQQVGERVFYDFRLERVADVITDIRVDGVDAVEVCSNAKTLPITNDVTIVHVATPYTSWKLRLWWDHRPARDDEVTVTYQARLYQPEERRTLVTYRLQTNTHTYYAGVAEPLE